MQFNLDEVDLLGDGSPAVAVMDPPATKNERSTADSVELAVKPRRRESKSAHRKIFTFDLETIPDDGRIDLFDLDPGPDTAQRTTVAGMGQNLPSVLLAKTVDEISKIVEAACPNEEFLAAMELAEKQRQKGPRDGVLKLIKKIRGLDDARLAAIESQRKDMATSPEMNRIVALGWAWGSSEPESMVVGLNGVTEADLLERFWAMAQAALKIVGFNILGFDIPTVCVRSMLLGVEPSRQIDLKSWGNDCIDLMKVRWPAGQARTLKWTAKALGIVAPAGDMDGSQVANIYQTNPAKVGEYVRSDVYLSQQIHGLYRGFFCS